MNSTKDSLIAFSDKLLRVFVFVFLSGPQTPENENKSIPARAYRCLRQLISQSDKAQKCMTFIILETQSRILPK